MTRQDQIFKWFCYAMGLFPMWLLDALVLPRYPVLGVTPNLLPLAVAAVAVLEGTTAGAGFGMAVGLLWAVGYPLGNGAVVLGLTVAGLLSGAVTQYALTQSFVGYLLCAAGTLAVLELARVTGGLMTQLGPAGLLLEVAGKEFLYSFIWTPVVYLIFRLVFRKVGGEKLA